MPFITGLLESAATFLCVGIICLQLASVAGNGVFRHTYVYGSQDIDFDIGIINVCVSTVQQDTHCSTCRTAMKYFDDNEGADGENTRFCGWAQGEPAITVGTVKGQYRGVQAVAMLTLIVAAAHFAATIAFVCDKIRTPIPAFITTFFLLVGGVTTVALAITTLNAGCTKTLCERLNEANSNGKCYASYTVYCEILSGVVAVATSVLLHLSNVKRRKTASLASHGVTPMPGGTPIAQGYCEAEVPPAAFTPQQ